MADDIAAGFVTWERFDAVCKQLALAEKLLRQAYPHIENLMPLARDPLNPNFRWVPCWLTDARRITGQTSQIDQPGNEAVGATE